MEQLSFITPIKPWEPVGDLLAQQKITTRGSEAALFRDVFKNAIQQVQDAQADVETKQYLLATGRLDDAHSLPIAEAKAALSVDVLISLRNKTIESYNELLKMSV